MIESVIIRARVRVNGRLKDPDGKWRDEITQELEASIQVDPNQVEKVINMIGDINRVVLKMQEELFANLHSAGGQEYGVRKLED